MLDELLEQFVERGYKWNIDGTLRPPSKEDLRKVLDRATELLYDDGMQLEVGRLIFVRQNGHIDVYLHMGAYNGD